MVNIKTSLSAVDAIIFGLYLVGVMAIGIYASRKRAKTKRDYFLAGDKLPWWMVGGSIVAANLSSHQLVGTMGVAYSRGFVAIITEWGSILLGFNALLWIFLPFYLRNGFYTMPEFLQKRFGGAARTTYSVLILLTYIFVEIGAVLYLGALTIHALLDIPMIWSVLALAIITGAYTIMGGLKAVIWTEMLQLFVLMFGMAALSYFTIKAAGGMSAVMATSKDWHMLLPHNDPALPWTMYLGGAVCTSVFYCATNQFIVQRTLAAKSEWHARMGVVFADYLKFLIPFMIIAPALVAAKMFPNLEKADLIFPTLVKNLLPSGLVGLVMAGLIAAIMSHLSGAINSCTTILTMDIYLPYFRQQASEGQSVMFGKVSGAIIVVLGILCTSLLMGHSDKPVFLYLLNAYGLFTPGIATMFLMGILSKRTTHAGALTAGLLTVPMSIIMQFLLPDMPFFNRTGIVFWTCMTVCMTVSYFTVPKPAEELTGLIWTRSSLALPQAERYQQRGLRNPFIWWAIVTVMVLFFYIRFA